jgi:N4-gp56 family major capsid protein
MAGEIKSTTSTLDDLIAPIVAEAQFVAAEKSIMRGLVKNFTVPANTGKVLQVPIYPKQTALALTEANDLTPSAISTSKKDITMAEVGLMTNVSDLSLNHSPSNVIADVGRLFGEAIATKIDNDLMALFGGFSTTVGSATTTATAALVFEAVARLRSAGVPGSDLAMVLHPLVAFDLKSALTTAGTTAFAGTGNSDVANEALRMGYVGMLAGVPVYETSNMPDASGNFPGTTGDYKGAVFHRDAIALAMSSDIRIETQRDASARATELVGVATYGVSEIHDSYGVEMEFDSTLQDA